MIRAHNENPTEQNFNRRCHEYLNHKPISLKQLNADWNGSIKACCSLTDLREILRLVGDALFNDWIVLEIQSSFLFKASLS